MNEQNEDFNPAKEVYLILDELDYLGLRFISDEIKTTIQNGKTELEKYSDNNDIKFKQIIIPFTKKEQIYITLEALNNYFIKLPELWDESIKNFKSKFKDIEITILDPETNEQVELYKTDFYKQKKEFKDLISKGLKYYSDESNKEKDYL